MTAIGQPHVATPIPNQVASRRDRTSRDAASDPRTAPAPTAAVSAPTPDSPVPSRSRATTTVNTVSAPRVKACAPVRPMSTARSRLAGDGTDAVDRLGDEVGPDARVGRGGASYRTRSISAAAQNEAPAASAKTAPTPVLRSRTAASRGPTSVATESSSPRTTFALASSWPVRQSEGSSAECAGRKSVAATVDTTASR